MRNVWKVLSVLAGGLLLSACPDITEPPASQVWTISWHPDCGLGGCGTSVTVLKGGAISQRGQATGVTSLGGSCTYYAPISGQWSGTIFKFTMNGGGCGGEQVQGFTQGTADGEYGSATTAHGTITWTFNNSGPITQTWSAYLLH